LVPAIARDRTFNCPALNTDDGTIATTANERLKSVRVLTDMPASLTMAFIANALGVTCLHCPTDVYESDEKPLKRGRAA
jgi:hypothetical protein